MPGCKTEPGFLGTEDATVAGLPGWPGWPDQGIVKR